MKVMIFEIFITKVNNFNFGLLLTQQNLLMKNKHITQINVYHTPDKSSRPDLKHQSHLKTTIPSVFQDSQSKYRSQYGVHHNKKNAYDFTGTENVYTQKRTSKDQQQLKQKVDEYETQISLLREYLRSCECNCIQKSSISRIFGFPEERNRVLGQQERVVRQLNTKVRDLINQNNSLKQQNSLKQRTPHINIQQMIEENHTLHNLLVQYKEIQALNQERFTQQNQTLKDEIYRVRIAYEQSMKSVQMQHQREIHQLRANQRDWLSKMELVQRRNEQSLRSGQVDILKARQVQEAYSQRLRETEAKWRKKLQEQQQYYQNMKVQVQNSQKDHSLRLHTQQLSNLKESLTQAMQQIESAQQVKLQKLQRETKQIQRRINDTNESMAHLKFQRENRIQSTVRKSQNIAIVSAKPRGQQAGQQPISQQAQPAQRMGMDSRTLGDSVARRTQPHQAQVLGYLQKQVRDSAIKLALCQRLVHDKTQRVITLQNQIRNLTLTINNLNLRLNQTNNKTLTKQVTKQVAVTVLPKQYTQQVRNIKQTIISCNVSNFEVFQEQFHQIITQRNQMNEKLMSLKRQAKESSKALVLEKHLKVQRQRNKQLQENIRRYESQIKALKIQVIELQNQIQSANAKQIICNAQQIGSISSRNIPDGKAGLQWQKVVKHCLMTSINRLQNLQNKMRQDTINKQ